MKRVLWLSLLAMLLAGALVIMGCSDEDNNNPPPAPDYAQTFDGTWDAQNLFLDSLNVDQMSYMFIRSSLSYRLRQTIGATNFDYTGTYSANATLVTFHETSADGTPVDTTYTRDYSFSAGDTVMTMEYEEVYAGGINNMDITYDKTP